MLSDYNDGIKSNNQVTFADYFLSCQWLRSALTVDGAEYDFLNTVSVGFYSHYFLFPF